MLYRIFSTTTPAPGTPPNKDRKIWKVNGNVTITLTSGTYWIEWQTHAMGNIIHFDPPSTIVGQRHLPEWNARRGQDSAGIYTYRLLRDQGDPRTAPNFQVDFPFEIKYDKTLPVTFLNFDGMLRNGQALLNWSTSNEINNKGFDVQRSMDGQNFATIGFVPGSGSSSSVNNYNYTDAKILSGSNYYRLKQMDLDGRYNYSSTIRLDFKKFDWAILGNPVNNSSWLQLQLDRTANVSIQIVSLSGKLVQTINKGNIVQGTYTIPLSLNNEASGLYIVKLMVDNQSYSKKIIK